MRKIYYIPDGSNVEDYRQEWEFQTNEVHTGISESIKEHVKNPEEAGWVYIPEFRVLQAPVNASDAEYWQVAYINDFINKDDIPQYVLEVWTKNLDKPTENQSLHDKYVLQYDIGAGFFHTDHIRLPIGWYDLILKFEDEEVEAKEITIYEAFINEEE